VKLVRPLFIRCLCVLTACVVPNKLLLAQDWVLSPEVALSALYTDNVNAEASSDNELIWSIMPSLYVAREGKRIQTVANYSLNASTYARSTNADSTVHNFSGRGSAELLRDSFFLDLSASYRRQLIDPTSTTSVRTYGDSDSYSDFFSSSINPYLIFGGGIGQGYQGRVEYQHEQGNFSQFSDSDAVADTWSLLLNSKPGKRVSWRLSYSDRLSKYENDIDIGITQLAMGVTIPLVRRLSAVLEGGQERSDYVSLALNQRISGDWWQVGGQWQPRRLVFVRFSVGERAFGRSYEALIDIKRSNSSWNLSYKTTLEDTFQNNSSVKSTESLVSVEPIDEFGELATVSNDVFAVKRTTASYNYSRGRFTGRVSSFVEKQESLTFAEQASTVGMNFSNDFSLSGRTNIGFGVDWFEQKYFGFTGTSAVTSFDSSLSRQLAHNLVMLLSYRYSQREVLSSELVNDENSLSVVFTYSF